MALSAIKNCALYSAMIYISLPRSTLIINLEFLKIFG